MTPATNPWAPLLALAHKPKLERKTYAWEHLPAGKRLYVAKPRVRSASKALALWLKRNGVSGKAHERHLGRACVWWEAV